MGGSSPNWFIIKLGKFVQSDLEHSYERTLTDKRDLQDKDMKMCLHEA